MSNKQLKEENAKLILKAELFAEKNIQLKAHLRAIIDETAKLKEEHSQERASLKKVSKSYF